MLEVAQESPLMKIAVSGQCPKSDQIIARHQDKRCELVGGLQGDDQQHRPPDRNDDQQNLQNVLLEAGQYRSKQIILLFDSNRP